MGCTGTCFTTIYLFYIEVKLQIYHSTEPSFNSESSYSYSSTGDLATGDPCFILLDVSGHPTIVCHSSMINAFSFNLQIQSDAVSTLVHCDPDLWVDPVR